MYYSSSTILFMPAFSTLFLPVFIYLSAFSIYILHSIMSPTLFFFLSVSAHLFWLSNFFSSLLFTVFIINFVYVPFSSFFPCSYFCVQSYASVFWSSFVILFLCCLLCYLISLILFTFTSLPSYFFSIITFVSVFTASSSSSATLIF